MERTLISKFYQILAQNSICTTISHKQINVLCLFSTPVKNSFWSFFIFIFKFKKMKDLSTPKELICFRREAQLRGNNRSSYTYSTWIQDIKVILREYDDQPISSLEREMLEKTWRAQICGEVCVECNINQNIHQGQIVLCNKYQPLQMTNIILHVAFKHFYVLGN